MTGSEDFTFRPSFSVASFSVRQIRPSLSVNHTAGDRSVAVDAAIAEEGPVAPNVLQLARSTSPYRISSLSWEAFGEHAAKGIAEKRSSPEFKPFARCGIAANVAGLEADTIHHAHINAVRNRMRPLNRAPGIMLRFAKFGLLGGMPSDRRRIKKNARSL